MPALELDRLARRLDAAAPGTLVESHGVWIRRLAVLARSLQACAGLALLLVAAVAAAVIAVATRAASWRAARRSRSSMGWAPPTAISQRASPAAPRCWQRSGASSGPCWLCRCCLTLANLAAPFAGSAPDVTSPTDVLAALPAALWLTLPGLPAAAAAIGFLTAQGTVRRWLRRLP